jgi:hypothetical protein
MPHFEIIEAKMHHCGKMVRRLRSEHARLIGELGVDPHRELTNILYASSYRRAWLIDGELAALGGVAGALASPHGYVWLAVSELALKYPLAMVKEARRQLETIMTTRSRLTTILIGNDAAARRFAIFLGFRVSSKGGGVTLSRLARRDVDLLTNTVDVWRPYGRGHVIDMHYEAA